MDEAKLNYSHQKIRNDYLRTLGISVETAKSIDVINQLLEKGSYDLNNKNNLTNALLIGILNKYNAEFLKFNEHEIGAFINTGFELMQERKQKRLAPGIITRHKLEIEFANGGEIFNLLMDQKILKKLTLTKGKFQDLNDKQRQIIKDTFPENWGRILALLGLSHDTKIEAKHKHFYETEGVQEWLKV